jgi:hypothetical protein
MTLLRRLSQDRMFRWGFLIFLIGSGPLLAIIAASKLGLLDDPNPNPVGPGILAMLTFWPGIVLMLVGLVRAKRACKDKWQ